MTRLSTLRATNVEPGPDGASADVSASEGVAGELLREHLAFIFRSLKRLGVAPAAVDDAVQDVFVVALRRESEFRGQSSFRTWLFGIAQNVARAYERKRQRALAFDALDDAQRSGGPSPLEQVTSTEALRFVDEFLRRLSDDKRAAFIMADLEQIPVPEIARALGVNMNTIYSRLRVARREFKGLMQERFKDEP